MKKYFNNCSSLEELKLNYRKLVLELHPDRGGNQQEFVQMQQEYELLLDMLPAVLADTEEQVKEVIAEKKYNRRVHILVNELGLTVILSDDWIWIKKADMDRMVLKSLKAALGLKLKIMSLGFAYSKRLEAWYWFSKPPQPRRTQSGRRMSLEEMAETFGWQTKSPKQI